MTTPHPSARIEAFLAEGHPTPFVVVDCDVVAERYAAFTSALPGVDVFYAVKANPVPEVLETLAALGSGFDVASPGEIDLCLSLGIPAERLSYGSTIKKQHDVRHAFERGVRLFAFDSEPELAKLIEEAPGALAYCRVHTDEHDADWPLSRKFGCEPSTAIALLRKAHDAGMRTGLSFHVGSQQRSEKAFRAAIDLCVEVMEGLAEEGIVPELLNIGGGFPAAYASEVPGIEAFGHAVRHALDDALGARAGHLRLAAEPGRFLVADAGVLRSEVVLVAEREDGRRWVYLDVGVFHGLAETLGEAIRYRIRTPHDGPGEAEGPVVVAGPTCDSVDVMYDSSGYQLPMALANGDHVDFLAAGAYTLTYSSIGFNGFPPIRAHALPRSG